MKADSCMYKLFIYKPDTCFMAMSLGGHNVIDLEKNSILITPDTHILVILQMTLFKMYWWEKLIVLEHVIYEVTNLFSVLQKQRHWNKSSV